MRQRPPDNPPRPNVDPHTYQNVVNYTGLLEEAERAGLSIESGPAILNRSSERENNVVPLSMAAKKTMPAIRVGALLVMLIACVLGGHVLNAKKGGPASPPIDRKQPSRDVEIQEGRSPPVPEVIGDPPPTEALPPTQVQTPATHLPPTRRPSRKDASEATGMGAPEAPAYGAPTADSPVDEFEVIDDISIKKNQGTLTRGGTATAGETSSETSVIGESEVVGGYETHKTGDKLLQEDLQKGTASEEAAQGQGEDVSKPSEELLREAKDLDLSMEKFENAYASASKTVQDAFILNYMPESARGPSTSPTDFFRRQVEISKVECQTGRLTSTESENALMDIQLVRNILEAASSRIELLRELEMLCDSSGIGSALLGKKAVPLPPAGALASDPNQATFEDFTLMLKGFKFRINEAALAAAGTVPVVLAQRLAASVKLETAQLENDRKVHSSFQKFILSLPQDKQQLCIVHANAIFGVEPFFQVIGRAIFDREANILTADALGSWVVDWNVEGILERLRLNEEDVGKLLGMRPNSYKATSIDDMFAAATALI